MLHMRFQAQRINIAYNCSDTEAVTVGCGRVTLSHDIHGDSR